MAESPAMPYEDVPAEDEPPTRTRRTPRRQTVLDEVANDLALWIDDTASKIALAFAPGRAPFAAELTEQQKLDFYTRQLFNPDGSPNTAGRQKEVARLGPEGFAQVYKAVTQAHPELKPRQAAEPDSIDALAPAPPGPVGPPPMMMGPPAGPPPMMPPPMMPPGGP